MDRRANLQGRERFEALREALAQRLSCVCSHFASDEIRRLTERMARIQLKYERDTAVPQA